LTLKATASRGIRPRDFLTTPTTVAAAATVPFSSTAKSATCLTKAIFNRAPAMMREKSAASLKAMGMPSFASAP